MLNYALNELPPDFESDLRTIADRLYSNHAVVMVGAGFSRNACEKYPDWNGLGDLFYSILHPGETEPKGHYWDVMDLADEVASSKGRSELEAIVQSRINDGSLKPSELHERLLKLPWADVFTTNYDTLLEATLPLLQARRYSVVMSENQLAHAECPRIIKLHGSFPSVRPYVLTTEDYRRYPEDHAGFVNTVRQAFLEHTFCLVGFSGDDPNFLSWAGWLRDNLGDYSKPIYLITMEEPSKSRHSLLARRNIRTVALKNFGQGYGSDFASGFRSFFDFIEKSRKDPEGWFSGSHVLNCNAKSMSLKEIVELWRREHKDYHGKLTVTTWQRELLDLESSQIAHCLHEAEDCVDLTLMTDFCYEYFWRLDLALRPAPERLVSIADKVFHSWRKRLLRHELDYDKSRLYYVAIQLMRVYREVGDHEKWESVNRTVKAFVKNTGGFVRDDYYYEVVLYHKYRLDSAAVLQALKEWGPSDANPLALARAGICYGALGNWSIARRYLADALTASRKMSAYGNDKRSLQIESIVIMAWRNACLNDGAILGDNMDDSLKRDLADRLNDLRRFDCDIRDDLLRFESFFKIPPEATYSTERHVSFDLGPDRVTNTFRRVWQDGYSYMRFCEVTGLPLSCIERKSYITALRSLVRQNMVQVLAYLRYQSDPQLVNEVLTREALLFLPSVVAEDVVTRLLNELKELVSAGRAAEKSEALNVLLQITSRLMCCELSTDVRRLAYGCVRTIFVNISHVPLFACIDDFVKRLIRATPIHEMVQAVETLSELPPVRIDNPMRARECSNPIYYLLNEVLNRPMSGRLEVVFSGVSVGPEKWRGILSGIGGGDRVIRKWNLPIAVLYAELKALSAQQLQDLRNAVVVSDDSNGFDVDLGEFFDCIVFELLDPETKGLKEWYLKRNCEGEWFESNCTAGGFAITGGSSVKINNLVVALEKYKDRLSAEDVESLISHVENEVSIALELVAKNDYGKHDLYFGGASLTAEGFSRAYALGRLVGKLADCAEADAFSARVEKLIKRCVDAGAPTMSMCSSVCRQDSKALKALLRSVMFSLNSHIPPIKNDGWNALAGLILSEDAGVRDRYIELAMSALSWANPSDSWFVLCIVRAAERNGLITIEFVACIFNMVARWKAKFTECCMNRTGDMNVVRDVVYLGRIMEIVVRSGELNEYRKVAVVDMWDTIAKPMMFSEVKEAWEFAWKGGVTGSHQVQ